MKSIRAFEEKCATTHDKRINIPQQGTQIIREKNTRRDAERGAEVTPKLRIQDGEINRGQERTSRTRRAHRFAGTSIGEFEDFDLRWKKYACLFKLSN
jgi:hypothetical protein